MTLAALKQQLEHDSLFYKRQNAEDESIRRFTERLKRDIEQLEAISLSK